MNWKCWFGKHEWKDNELHFTHDKLRECVHCKKTEVFFIDKWIPFEGIIAGFLLGRAAQKGESMTVERK